MSKVNNVKPVDLDIEMIRLRCEVYELKRKVRTLTIESDTYQSGMDCYRELWRSVNRENAELRKTQS